MEPAPPYPTPRPESALRRVGQLIKEFVAPSDAWVSSEADRRAVLDRVKTEGFEGLGFLGEGFQELDGRP